jgi:CheY-like chemotaxis protein
VHAHFRVVEARDGFEGVRQNRLCRPDLVILDLDLPGMGGREVLATLMRDRPDLPVIITTGQASSRHEIGCRAWLGKPYSAAVLVDTARAAVCGD